MRKLLAALDAAIAERDQYAQAIQRHKDDRYPDKRGGWIERPEARLYAVLEPGYISPLRTVTAERDTLKARVAELESVAVCDSQDATPRQVIHEYHATIPGQPDSWGYMHHTLVGWLPGFLLAQHPHNLSTIIHIPTASLDFDVVEQVKRALHKGGGASIAIKGEAVTLTWREVGK